MYAAAWLVADCAAPLMAKGESSVRQVVRHYAAQVDGLGVASLSAHYAALRREAGG